MRDRLFIKEDIADKITYYHLLVFVATLPFNRLYSELALISLTLHTLFQLRLADLKRVRIPNLLCACSLYLLTLVATLYTSFKGEAFGEWERQAALLLFPLLISVNRFDFRKYTLNIVLVMAFSCAATILYLYGVVFTTMVDQHLALNTIFSRVFINHNFAAPIDMHATYFSMYIALGAVGVYRAVVEVEKRTARLFYTMVFLVLVMGLVQLSSRAVLISFAGILLGVIPFYIHPRQKRVYAFVGAFALIGVVLFILVQSDSLHNRVTVELKEDLVQTDAANNLLEPRVVRWRAAKDIIMQSPVYGHGSGSEIPLLKDVYYRHKLYNSYLNSLNIHNQYLSMMIKTGVVGWLVLLWVLVSGFSKAFRYRDGLFVSFLLIVAVVSFSENILDGNKGIFFFACFFSLFYIGSDKKKFIRK